MSAAALNATDTEACLGLRDHSLFGQQFGNKLGKVQIRLSAEMTGRLNKALAARCSVAQIVAACKRGTSKALSCHSIARLRPARKTRGIPIRQISQACREGVDLATYADSPVLCQSATVLQVLGHLCFHPNRSSVNFSDFSRASGGFGQTC